MKRWRRVLMTAGVLVIGWGTVVAADVGTNTGGGGGGGEVGGGDVPCPNERACNVDARYTYSGHKRRCGVGIKIFGVGGAIFGQVCYEHEILTPAHQECHGVSNPGTRCVKEEDMIVKARDCKCGGGMLPLINTGFPTKCKCGEYMNVGTVEDFATRDC